MSKSQENIKLPNEPLQPGAREKVFFPNLDALRFIAFSLVFLQHGFYNAFVRFEGQSQSLDRILQCTFARGGTGVQIFFVLSGFLISYLIIKEIQQTGKLNLMNFYMRRTLRIWPLYFATVTFAFVIYPFLKNLVGIHSDLCSHPWYYFSFLANFDLIRIARECAGQDAMSQGIVWSVSIEEQFYLVWPLLFIIFRRAKPLVFVSVLSGCIIYRIAHNASVGEELYYHTFAVMGDLAIGGLGAYLAIYSRSFLGFFNRISSRKIAIVYSGIFLAYFYSDIIFTGGYEKVYTRWLFDACWTWIILEQNFAHNGFKLGRLKWFSNWGKYTYGLYMLHPVAILVVDISLRLLHLQSTAFLPMLLGGFAALILSMIISKLSYRFLELPFLRIKEKFAIIRTKIA